MEVRKDSISGWFHAEKTDELDDSDDEDVGDDLHWLYENKDSSGQSFVSLKRHKTLLGWLTDVHKEKEEYAKAPFHLSDPWWECTILRTRQPNTGICFRTPTDKFALAYKLRKDPGIRTNHIVTVMIKEINDCLDATREDYNTEDSGGENTKGMKKTCTRVTEEFFKYLKDIGVAENELDFENFEERVRTFCLSSKNDKKDVLRWQRWMVESPYSKFAIVKKAKSYPTVFYYLPQLLPNQFTDMIGLGDSTLRLLEKAIQERPWVLAFKTMMKDECKVMGCETSRDALIKSGLMQKVPEVEKDALFIYEFIKKETKANGHTGVKYTDIKETLESTMTNLLEAIKFLEDNGLVKREKEGGLSVVYLYTLWKAEERIATGIQMLINLNKKEPWKLNVNWQREDLQDLKADPFQWKAAHLIAEQPVVAVSGKGGCGKTHVVTKVIKSAKVKRHTAEGTSKKMKTGSYLWTNDDNTLKEQYLENQQVLLTAPTGKAANLLGKRAGQTGYTLHQVIFSYKKRKQDEEWTHKDVHTLVVDECSLVSVGTFSSLLDILQENSNLRQVILLGDIRQLPSIEPGNFLLDIFESMKELDCSVELNQNHRSESALIVDNATRISNMCDPQFDEERKFTMWHVSDGDAEFAEQGAIVAVRKLLETDALQSDEESQFVCFQRKTCEAINDICCNRYSDHRIKEGKRFIFQPKDKICCTRNGWVTKFGDRGGSIVPEKEEGSQKDSEVKRIRLCNGEIFFIIDDIEIQENRQNERYLKLSDKDVLNEFWVNFKEIMRECRLRHAWARTIHTFQGSETETIVYVVGNNKWQTWQHVYTAITRGKNAVFIVGQKSALFHAVHKTERKRRTSLKRQLRKYLEETKSHNSKPDLTIAASQVEASPSHARNVPAASCSQTGPTILSSCSTEACSNGSQNSQWSDVDESQYLNIDIPAEEFGEDDLRYPTSQGSPSKQKTSPEKQNHSYVEIESNTTPNQNLTSIKTTSEQSFLNSSCHKRLLGAKPCLGSNELCSPTKRKVNHNQKSVSPVNRTLAKLDFQSHP